MAVAVVMLSVDPSSPVMWPTVSEVNIEGFSIAVSSEILLRRLPDGEDVNPITAPDAAPMPMSSHK